METTIIITLLILSIFQWFRANKERKWKEYFQNLAGELESELDKIHSD